MTIKTKFGLKKYIYAMCREKPVKFQIFKIQTITDNRNTQILYSAKSDKTGNELCFWEYCLDGIYTKKKDLINSLKNS